MFAASSNLMIIGSVARKDLLAALKNRTILTTVLAFSLGMAVYFIAPLFMNNDDLPGLVVVGEPTDPLLAELLQNPTLNLILVQDRTEMEWVLGEYDAPLIGLASPITPAAPASAEEPVLLDAYMDHWVSNDQVTTTERFFEALLSDSTGQAVNLEIHHEQVYTRPEGAHPFNFTFPMIALLLFIGISVGPNLILEEKETKTLDMLLISPASIGQIIAGKAIVAVLYGFIAALILFLLKNHLVTYWPIALLAAFTGSLFTSSLGLLFGVVLKDRQQLIIWSQVVLIGLLLPIFVHAILQDTSVGAVLSFIPTVALGKLVRVALSYDPSVSLFAFELAWLASVICVLLFLIGWTIRRSQSGN